MSLDYAQMLTDANELCLRVLSQHITDVYARMNPQDGAEGDGERYALSGIDLRAISEFRRTVKEANQDQMAAQERVAEHQPLAKCPAQAPSAPQVPPQVVAKDDLEAEFATPFEAMSSEELTLALTSLEAKTRAMLAKDREAKTKQAPASRAEEPAPDAPSGNRQQRRSQGKTRKAQKARFRLR